MEQNKYGRSEIIIKINPNESLETILKGIDFTATKNEFVANQYLVKIKKHDTFKIFDIINSLANDSRIDFIEPNFTILNAFNTVDPFYASQWSIKNEGYLGGTVDADMDVEEAWQYSIGTGIKVAVLDTGVDLTHPDLQANLLPGYDAVNNTAGGGYVDTSFHGTATAGIIGAVGNNNIGTVGIAYGAKIIPIRIGSEVVGINNNDCANGINWAWQNGADILSNSWGGGSPSSAITNAINNAVTNGRSGKGCVVLFSSGNCNIGVSYPASLSNVIAVGASNQCDQRKSPNSCDGEAWSMQNCSVGGSNYGVNLDIVAPGVKIYTTDASGSAGYSIDDYTSTFNGTSAACPNAAGVMALILSLKPSLTYTEARQILESSTDKVASYSYTSGVSGQPNGSWNNEVGYGRVNALKAVKLVYPYKLSGSTSLCTIPGPIASVSITPTPPAGTIINWSVSSNLNFHPASPTTPNSTYVFVQNAAPLNSYGTAYVYASVNGIPLNEHKIELGQKPFSYTVQKSTSFTEYCDYYYHYLSLDVINTDTAGNYTYSFSNLTAGMSNSGITYIQTSTNSFLFKIPLNKIPAGANPAVFIYSVAAMGTCSTAPNMRNGQAIVLIQCTLVGPVGPPPFYRAQSSISPVAANSYYAIYPNPSSSILNISLTDENWIPSKSATIAAVLYDINGVEKTQVTVIDNAASLDVSKLKKGTYILKIDSNGSIESHQIIIN